MRPDLTKAQIVAAAAAGVPILVNLLAAFGVFVPSPAEQHAISEATKWATGFALVLIAGDAHLRSSRNKADAARSHSARTDAAAKSIADAASRMREAAAAASASAEPGRGEFGTAAASAGAVAHDEGPGDADQMPHFVTSDPLGGRVPPDEVDLGSEPTP